MMKTQLYVSPENALYRRIELQHMPNGKLRMEGVDMSGIRGCRNRWIPGLAPLARNDPARWQPPQPSPLVTGHSNLPKAGISLMARMKQSGIRGCRNRWIPGLASLARNDPARWQPPSALVTRHSNLPEAGIRSSHLAPRHSNLPKAGIISSHLAPRHSNLTSCAARRRPSCLWWREG